jgi:hypothetical protein
MWFTSPDQFGFEAIRVLQRDGSRKNVPVV